MKRLRHLITATLALAFAGSLAQAAAAPKKVLFFTKCSGFEHSVIAEPNGQTSFAGKVLLELGPKHGIEFTLSKDGSLFTPEYLGQFDAIFFYTSGDLSAKGRDGNPPISAAGKKALLDAVLRGKGFIGAHSAADTYHLGEDEKTNTGQPRTWRYRVLGDKADPYTRMLGAEFIIHGSQQIGPVAVPDPKFPGFGQLGASFELHDEWYSLTDFSPDLHVLLLQDTANMKDPYAGTENWPPAGWNTPYQRPSYPSTWARMHGNGRVFYTSLAHREENWRNPKFQQLLFGGIAWAVRNVDADVTPNIAKVAPQANVLPPVSAPVVGDPETMRIVEEMRKKK
jgi:uncharacterized protein